MTETDAADLVAEKITHDGPMTVADYMKIVSQAYYGGGDVFGRSGDFVTAPEISQVFGELIGLWCVTAWQALGAPRAFHLIECGPGRGTLMADALRVISDSAPEFMKDVTVHLVEQSPALRAVQETTLKNWDMTWHDDLSHLPNGPCIIVGNEFLDALPIRQFEKTTSGWRERLVDFQDGEFYFVCAEHPSADVDDAFDDAATGSILEKSEAVEETVRLLAQHCVEHRGTTLMIDYGHTQSSVGDTLQSVRQHDYHPVLKDPGTADLTAHVDFALVAQAARSAQGQVFGPVEQGLWLRRLGALVRETQLTSGKSAEAQKAIRTSIRRLIEPDGMGLLFKAIAFATPDIGPLAGFEVGA